MKKILCFALSLILLLCIPTSVTATTELTLTEATIIEEPMLLSDMTEQECLEFVIAQGVDIPDDYEDITIWAPFVKDTIIKTEENPNCIFVINYTVTLEFARAIQDVVNDYYAANPDLLDHNFVNTATAESEYTLTDSVVYGDGVYYLDYQFYNCYAYAINDTDVYDEENKIYMNHRYHPGDYSNRTFSLSLDLSTQIDYIKYDLQSLGYDCVKSTVNRPLYGSLDSDERAICYRTASTDFHFMRMGSSAWYHKPGTTIPLKYLYNPTTTRAWTNECVDYDGTHEPSINYTGALYFIIYSPTHNYKYTYIGSGCHKIECTDCDYVNPYARCSPASGGCDYCGN